MAYWSIALLLVSVSFLAYRHPPQRTEALSRWLRPARRRSAEDHQDGQTPGSDQTDGSGAALDERVETEVSTPKAVSADGRIAVPTFSLNDDSAANDEKSISSASNGAAVSPRDNESVQSTSLMPPPPKPTTLGLPRNPSSNTMPPPPRPNGVSPPSSAGSLRIPSNGPLPHRGIPANSQQRVSGGFTVNGAVPTPNPRGKVLLSPGHSPMDWAALTRQGNLSGVSTFQRVTPSTLKTMTGRKGKPAWSSWKGSVYNITPYIPFHPGGEAEIMKAAGRDGTKLFMEVHPWVNWENMLGSCLVGVLVPEDYGMGTAGRSSLEDMD